MSANITGSAGITIGTHIPPVIEIKRGWWDTWQWEPDLSFHGGQVCVAGEGESYVKVGRRYGEVKQPWESTFPSSRASWDLNGWWVRVSFLGPYGAYRSMFVGRIDTEERELHGADNGPSGHQEWTCYGPEMILKKTSIGRSFWLVPDAKADAATPGVVTELGVAYDFNREDEGQFGNKTTYREDETATEDGKCYLFGGTLQWSNYDIIEYLLAKFLDESEVYEDPVAEEDPGPKWRLAGQVEPLKSMYQTIDVDKTQSLQSMLKKLIPIDKGLDYIVRPFEEKVDDTLTIVGYELYVYAISYRDWTFGSQTLPANPNIVHFDLARSEGIQVNITKSAEHMHGRLRLLGERIVLCGSLWGTEASSAALLHEDGNAVMVRGLEVPWNPVDVWGENVLTKRWTDGLETDYETANGEVNQLDPTKAVTAGDIRRLDEIRSGYKYQPVFQHFGAPDEWDLDTGGWAPSFNNDGEIVLEQVDPDEEPEIAPTQQVASTYQIQVRKTLNWLPLLAGHNYVPVVDADGNLQDTSWPENENTAVDRNELLSPTAWVYDPSWGGFVDVAKIHEISVKAPRHDWGVHLNVTPNHYLAKNHWDGSYLTLDFPKLDWQDLVCTIAVEMDHRYTVDIELPDARPSDGVKEVPVQDCQLWVLAPCTMLRGKRWDDDTTWDRNDVLVHSGLYTRILRRDSEKMEVTAAGCVSRYLAERARARFVAKGLLAWSGLCGHLLGWINQGGDMSSIQAPITKVSWRVTKKKIETTVYAGFAR